jgi:DNA mismatch endonuclease, patch repair protein
MTDVLSPEQRSYNMSRIRSKDTKPELIVRSILVKLGFRYRLHTKTIPGNPDIVLTKNRKLIFVHGCYWHLHSCKYGKVAPKTNAKFWKLKRMGNKKRDMENFLKLKKMGWRKLIIWECEIKKDGRRLIKKISQFLSEK